MKKEPPAARQTIRYGLLSVYRLCVYLIFIGGPAAPLFSQTVQVLRKSDFVPQREPKTFEFICSETDTARLDYIATLRARGTPDINRVTELYSALKKKASDLGANCYTFCDYYKDRRILTLHVYHAADSILQQNLQHGEKNTIYVFSNDLKKSKEYDFCINDEEHSVVSASYYRYRSREGEEVKINRCGPLGAVVRIKGMPNEPPTFLCVGGLDVWTQPGSNVLSINPGSLQCLESGLAHLLIRVWAPKE